MDIGAREEARQKSIEVFFCYAREDEALLNKLKTHLRPLQRQGLIDVWYDREISAGTEWEQEIKQHLNTAQIILLLVSPDFMDSDYCYGIEMTRAIERHKSGEARVIPIILRWAIWKETPIGKLQALPTGASPITSGKWHDQDEAFYDVAKGIREAVEARLAEETRVRKTAEAEQSRLAEEEEARKAAEARVKALQEKWARKAAEERPPTPSIPASNTPSWFQPRIFPTPPISTSSTPRYIRPPSLNQQFVQPQAQREKVPATTKQRVRRAIIVDAFLLNLLGTSVGLGILLHAWWIAVICLVGESLLTSAGLLVMALVKVDWEGQVEPSEEVPRRALLVLLLPIGIVWGLVGWFINPFVSSQVHFLYLPQGLAAVGFLLGLFVNFFISSPLYLWLVRRLYWFARDSSRDSGPAAGDEDEDTDSVLMFARDSSGDSGPAAGKRQAPINRSDMFGVPNSLVISIPLAVWSGSWGIFFLSLLCSLILLTLCIAIKNRYLIRWPTVVICVASWALIGWLIGSWPAHLIPDVILSLNSAILSKPVTISWGEIVPGAGAIAGICFAFIWCILIGLDPD